jgi:predicted transcriptional regulator
MKKLARLRRTCGLSQYELARRTAIPLSRIVYGELGARQLTDGEIGRIKQVLSERAKEISKAVVAVA